MLIQLCSYETPALPVYDEKWVLLKVKCFSIRIPPYLCLVEGYQDLSNMVLYDPKSQAESIINLLNKSRLFLSFFSLTFGISDVP